MKKTAALLAFWLAAAPLLADDTAPRPGRKSGRFWTGVGLLATGVGAAAVAGMTWNDRRGMDERLPMAWGGKPSGRGPGAFGAQPGMMAGAWPGLMAAQPGWGMPRQEMRHGNRGNAVALGLGVAAAGTGLALVLTSRGEREPRTLSVQAAPGRVQLRYAF